MTPPTPHLSRIDSLIYQSIALDASISYVIYIGIDTCRQKVMILDASWRKVKLNEHDRLYNRGVCCCMTLDWWNQEDVGSSGNTAAHH
jgi:hypothetical protein